MNRASEADLAETPTNGICQAELPWMPLAFN